MPALTAADTIRILVATDSHVGYMERDSIRGDDSWKSFHEVMCLAKEQDVDMVLLAGDLFHENKPSRKSMYQVMRSLRLNCYGERPCELEMLSDGSETFSGAFNHVNYEDPDINVSIPVFSIHGNHDDPTGEGHLAALDLLQISGLVNYYGRTPESDNIQVKPVLLQKGHTKLALYGMSNVRDERLFRTFRDGKVKFYRPSTQKEDWFNLMSVHQNHVAHTETGYLREDFLPDFLDLVVWGHEHECLIEPRLNTEMGFSVMQPGSSIATSLMPGEAKTKHVAVLSITGKDYKVEPIRLKTVRPFIWKDIVLQENEDFKKHIKKLGSNRTHVTQWLMGRVDEMIEQAKAEWMAAQEEPEPDEELEVPLPLVRLRIEYTAPGGGSYEVENPQRFSNRFVGRVANTNDVVSFIRKKAGATRKGTNGVEVPEDSILSQLSLDSIKVDKLVREYLQAQNLLILPQNSFGDAVNQFVDKDDKHAMEMFVTESLEYQTKHLLSIDDGDEEDMSTAMDNIKAQLEEAFAAGRFKIKKAKLRPKPDGWDSDEDGEWARQPGAFVQLEDSGDEEASEEDATPAAKPSKGRGKATAPKKTAAATKRAAPAKSGRGKKKVVEEESEEEDEDIVMLDNDEDEDGLFVKAPTSTRATKKAPIRKAASPAKRSRVRAAPTKSAKQSTLTFSQPNTQANGRTNGRTNGRGKKVQEISDDDISDDDDAFEPFSTAKSTGSRR